VTIALQREPVPVIGTLPGDRAGPLLHTNLVWADNKGVPFPALATELPSQDKGTWVVNADGSMTTIYKLRPNMTWHDGKPLTTQDFVFAWQLGRDAELAMAPSPAERQISAVETPDDQTLVLRWSSAYPLADQVYQLGPYPVHLLKHVYEADKAALENDPYWGEGFIGVGPYRLQEWQRGVHFILKAYEGFYGPRPKIDTLIFKLITDEQTTAANLLGGAIDGAFAGLDFGQVITVKEQMEQRGQNPWVFVQPTFVNIARVQFDERIGGGQGPRPPELTDVRVRRALLHAIDRAEMAGFIYPGYGLPADTPMNPEDPKFEWMKDSITRYPYDQRRAQELLIEAGWQRGADGQFRNAAGQPISLHYQATTGGQWEMAQTIAAASWKAIGIPEVETFVVPQAQRSDRELTNNFRAIRGTPVRLETLTYMQQYQVSQCPTAANRWVGVNGGCYREPELDRVSNALLATVNPSEQQRLWREWGQLFTRDLPALPLFFHVQGTIFRDGFSGFRGESPSGGQWAWSYADWDIK
jgi:peptide/nickel transport system substrate-binding protein